MMGTMSVSIICSSLYVLVLLEIPQVKCQVVLDMAPDAFDDQYLGCEEKMVEKMSSDHLLEDEKSKNEKFKSAWEEAASIWEGMVENEEVSELPKGFRDEHGIAILVYITTEFHKEFDNAVRTGGTSPEHYMEKFHFKVLHFYLTTALRMLRGNCRYVCQRVHRGQSNIIFIPPTSSDKNMRFGQFTFTSTNKRIAKIFGNDSFFTLTTCFGVCTEEFSYFPIEKEVLLPVNEVFTVLSFDDQTHSFVLNSTRETCSRYNCAYLEGLKAKVGTTYPYCYSSDAKGRFERTRPHLSRSAPGFVPLLFIMKMPQLFTGIYIVIAAVTPRLLFGF